MAFCLLILRCNLLDLDQSVIFCILLLIRCMAELGSRSLLRMLVSSANK